MNSFFIIENCTLVLIMTGVGLNTWDDREISKLHKNYHNAFSLSLCI